MTRSVWLGALALIGLGLTIALPAEGAETTIDWQCSSVSASGAVVVGNCPVSTTNPLPITGSFSATTTGFSPASVGTPISVTTGGVTGTLPSGTVVIVSNAGATNTAYCALGASSTTAQQPIPPGGWFAFTVGAATQLTCITSASTTTINMVGGSGLPTGSGGGGGGSGGGGAITAASGAYAAGSLAAGAGVDGWNLTEGAKADAAWTSGSGSIVALLKAVAGFDSTIATAVASAIPTQAPTVSIGGVGIVDSAGTNVATVKAASTLPVAADKTLVVGLNPGTATAGSPTGAIVTVQGVSGGTAAPVSLATAPALVASSAIIGKVGIDQTTPGTTNAVVQTSQYPAGATAQSISTTGTTGATTATLGGAASNYTFLCGFSIRANATAAATNNATVTGTVTGTLNFTQWTAPLASGLGVTEEIFTPCIPSASTGTSQIAVVSGAPGSGGVVSVTAWGYYKTTTP